MEYLRRAAVLLSSAFHLQDSGGRRPESEKRPDVKPSGNAISSSKDVIEIALLLREKLPGDIIPLVLDYAQMWNVKESTCSLRPDRVGELQAPKLQAALFVPNYLPRGSIRRIKFIVESRDQGWSSYPQDHGTYRGSWTWFEAGIRGFDASNVGDQATLLEPVDCQHRNALDDEHKSVCLQDVTRYKYGSKRIVTNVHAGRDFRQHVVYWDLYHEDGDVRTMVQELGGGHRIEVSAHARFPGWSSYVKSVAIEIECAVVRKM